MDWCIVCVCEVSASLESSRQNRALPGGLPAKFHHRVVDARRSDCHVHALWRGPSMCSKQCEEWSTRGGQSKPVQLTRFQSLHLAAFYWRLHHASLALQVLASRVRLCLHLHRVRRWLRRGKGVLWVADPRLFLDMTGGRVP